MIAHELRTSRVAIHGRVADALTRADLGPRRYRASLLNHQRNAVQKRDGHFAFADLAPSPPDYSLALSGREFQSRTLAVPWPGPGPLALEPAGEDELQLVVTGVAANRVSFAPAPFLPLIPEGSPVFGAGGFMTTLAEDLGGVEIDGAELQTIGAIVTGDILRVVRSRRMLLRPGPAYDFPPDTTLIAFRVIEDSPAATPIAGAEVQITEVDGVALSSVTIGGVVVFHAALPGPPPTSFLVGTAAARSAMTTARGDAVFYYAPNPAASALTVAVSRAGYTTRVLSVGIVPAQRTFELVQLVRT